MKAAAASTVFVLKEEEMARGERCAREPMILNSLRRSATRFLGRCFRGMWDSLQGLNGPARFLFRLISWRQAGGPNPGETRCFDDKGRGKGRGFRMDRAIVRVGLLLISDWPAGTCEQARQLFGSWLSRNHIMRDNVVVRRTREMSCANLAVAEPAASRFVNCEILSF